MNNATLEAKERGLNGIERKVYEAVPIESIATTTEIMAEIHRMTGAKPEKRTVQFCLGRLRDDGLVKESDRGYRRVSRQKADPPAVESLFAASPAVDALTVAATPTPAAATDPLTQFSALIDQALAIAEQAKRMAANLETLAISIQERLEQVSEGAAKLQSLKQLMKEFANG